MRRILSKWWPYLAGVALIAVVVSGCTFYNERFEPVEKIGPKDGHDLYIVQADDYGSFWKTGDASVALKATESASKSGNVLVVVFIHGWHNNAQQDNQNLQDFDASLDQLSNILKLREQFRSDMTGSKDVKLIGIYIGWRGRSLPWYADYATVWGRKSTAEIVGDGDVSQFIERLHRTQLRANEFRPECGEIPKKPFFGLVTMGHSLGGQVLLRSIQKSLEYSLIERSTEMTDSLNPEYKSNADRNPVRESIDSFGDLNILLNPALEAYQFAQIDALYRQLQFPSTQTPQLVVFSASNDLARKIAFPLSRAVLAPFDPPTRADGDRYQSALFRDALGDLDRQRTHNLALVSPNALDSLLEIDLNNNVPKVLNFDFTEDLVFSGVQLTRNRDGKPWNTYPTPYSPIVVIQTTDDLIQGHSGIFEIQKFDNFLAGYITFIEAKRILLRKQKFDDQLRQAAEKPKPEASPQSTACTTQPV